MPWPNWIRRYRIRTFFANAFWAMPVAALLLGLVLVRTTVWIDTTLGLEHGLLAESARNSLMMLASAQLTFMVFLCSSLLVAVQLASAQLSPRIISLVYRDLGTRLSLSIFAFSFAFTFGVAVRTRDTVPLISVMIATYGSIITLIIFFYLIDHLGRGLRPVGALRRIARIGERVVDEVYPHRLADPASASRGPERDTASVQAEVERLLAGVTMTEVTAAKDGTLQAFDVVGLVALAVRRDCVIELVPQAGHFISRGDALFRVYGAATPIEERVLRGMVAVGMERTYEQDPSYALRNIVDVASKALSPAINDPTTAVLAIDQIHQLLRRIGTRRLDEGIVHDPSGRMRFISWTRDWEDFVRLAVTEIRHFGGESIQVMRRLRAMLDDLARRLAPERAALLRRELTILDRGMERLFSDPEDRAMAVQGDLQGVGGAKTKSGPGGAEGGGR